MLPNQSLSSPSLPGTLLSPRQQPRSAADRNVQPFSIGGAGFRDTTQGLKSQVWTGTYDGLNVVLTPQVGSPVTIVFADLIWFDFCFDQSMNPVVAYADKFGGVFFYWFDTTIGNFRTTTLPFGTDPWPFCQFDDPRPEEAQSSDVVICYTRGTHLYFLAQRDRFGIEYDLGAISVDPPKVLVAAGMSTVNRFQFEFAQILPNLSFAYGKFVGSKVFKAVEIGKVGSIKPRIWPTRKNNTVYG